MPVSHPPLPDHRARDVLAYMGIDAVDATCDLPGLARLVDAYVRHIPWESASRIVRHGKEATPVQARDPEEFWCDTMADGTGGTCFESNDAFFALLRSLGFDGHLTINDMGDTCACHTATIIEVDDQRFLVDVGLPLYAIIPLDQTHATSATSAFHTYTATPTGDSRWEITRTNHPRVSCFTLIGNRVPTLEYRDAATRDYGPGGLFLDRVVITRIVNGSQWRFSSGERPWCLERFEQGQRFTNELENVDDPPARIAAHFDMRLSIIRNALERCEDL